MSDYRLPQRRKGLLQGLLPVFRASSAVFAFDVAGGTRCLWGTLCVDARARIRRSVDALERLNPFAAPIPDEVRAGLARIHGKLASPDVLRGTPFAECAGAVGFPRVAVMVVADDLGSEVRGLFALGRTLEEEPFGEAEQRLAEGFLPWLELAVPSSGERNELIDDLADPENQLRLRRLTGLSSREIEIATDAARGARNREIASALSVSEATVRSHLRSVFRKLGVRSRGGLLHALVESARERVLV